MIWQRYLIITVVQLAALVPAAAQSDLWRHELLVEGLLLTPPSGYVNPSGVAVYAAGTDTGTNVFVGGRNFSLEVLGASAHGTTRAINARGDVLWTGGYSYSKIMLDTTNISFPVVGGGLQLHAHALSENGRVLWSAAEPGRWRLFRDSEDLNTSVIGFGSAMATLDSKMNATGHVL